MGISFPSVPVLLEKLSVAGISIPIAILIWIMIYPMMKVDFQSVKQIGKNPKGLFVTWIVNWLVKPFTMYAIASVFLFTVFKNLIEPELATEYLAGAVPLGAVRLMKTLHGIDMEKTQFNKLIADIPKSDVVIFMGCNIRCPVVPGQYSENWGLDDPTGQSDEVFEKTIRKIEENIICLKKKLAK